jgi:hypothetical protein
LQTYAGCAFNTIALGSTPYLYGMYFANVSFTKLIKSGDKLREFNFRKLPNKENVFHVDVADDKGKRIVFTMQPDGDGSWQIIEGDKPAWLYFSVDLLAKALGDEWSAG